MPRKFFDDRLSREWIGFTILRRVTIAFLVVHFSLSAVSGYRAIVQVYDVDIQLSSGALRPGSPVAVRVVTSGRNPVDARLELVQAGRADTIAMLRVRANSGAFQDPRPQRAVLKAMIPSDVFQHFAPGRASLRAVAEGRSQWLRIPPPEVRLAAIDLLP